jgi:hypothetical protein
LTKADTQRATRKWLSFIEFRLQERTVTVIAMTREIGSLGTEVAARVAKRLGLEIVRSEVAANNVARRLGVAEGAVLRYLDGSASLLERWQIDRRKLFHYAAEEILGLAQKGNVLIAWFPLSREDRMIRSKSASIRASLPASDSLPRAAVVLAAERFRRCDCDPLPRWSIVAPWSNDHPPCGPACL